MFNFEITGEEYYVLLSSASLIIVFSLIPISFIVTIFRKEFEVICFTLAYVLHYSWVANSRDTIINFSSFLGPPLVRLAKDSITNCTLYCPWVRILLGRLCYYITFGKLFEAKHFYTLFSSFFHIRSKTAHLILSGR